MTPGIKTTEMWLTLLSLALQAAILLIPSSSPLAQLIGTLSLALTSTGYGVGRQLIKSTDAKLQTNERLELARTQRDVLMQRGAALDPIDTP